MTVFPVPPRSAVGFAAPSAEIFDTPFVSDDLYLAFGAVLEAPLGNWLNLTAAIVADRDTDDVGNLIAQIDRAMKLSDLQDILSATLRLSYLVGRASVVADAERDGLSRADLFSTEFADKDDLIFQGAPFDLAVQFLRQKAPSPSREWRDVLKAMHDRSFAVAGEMKAEVLTDIQTSLLSAMEEGGEPAFRKAFDELVNSGKWTGDPEIKDDLAKRAWRAKVIYRTNMRTAHAAGRRKQQLDLVDVLPFWVYRHGATRTPRRPRVAHIRLDGMTLPATDPTWDRVYAPNGFECSCAIQAVTQAAADRAHINHRTAPTEAEIAELVPLEWQYAPGAEWNVGLDQVGGAAQ